MPSQQQHELQAVRSRRCARACRGSNLRAATVGGFALWLAALAAPAQTPSMLNPVVSQLAAGTHHSCAVVEDAGVLCWGNNSHGQLGDNSTDDRSHPVPVQNLGGAVLGLAAGLRFSCALETSGGVQCWGYNGVGQLGTGNLADSHAPGTFVQLLGDAVQISAGLRHACALLASGSVACWGSGDAGQLGDGMANDSQFPVGVTALGTRAVAIDVGASFSCALTTAHEVYCWGDNRFGQLGDGSTVNRPSPERVHGLGENVVAISAGGWHACALLDSGTVKCWGANDHGQVGDGSYQQRQVPTLVQGLPGNVRAVAAGPMHSCAIAAGGSVWCWGDGGDGQLGDGAGADRPLPVAVTGLAYPIAELALGGSHTCARSVTGSLACWGGNSSGQLGTGDTTGVNRAIGVPGLTGGVAAVAPGVGHTCALVPNGAVKCWGDDSYNQLGNGSAGSSLAPVAVALEDNDSVAIVAGSDHTCALSTIGLVHCWGRNDHGQLGNGSNNPSAVPVAVTGYFGVTDLALGASHSCLLTAWGGVVCWGANDVGQLGDGSDDERGYPDGVLGLGGGVTSISAGSAHNCALMETDVVKCWGDNASGQVGDGSSGSNASRDLPVAVAGLGSNLFAVTAGGDFSCALATAGSAQCWGSNAFGQLGNAYPAQGSPLPVAVDVLHAAVTISSGGFHSCARIAGSGAKCWGRNDAGQLGDGSTDASTQPVTVANVDDVAMIRAGANHSCVVTGAGGLQCWGVNTLGQLGNGSTTASTVPVDVRAGRSIEVPLPTRMGLTTIMLSQLDSDGTLSFSTWTPQVCQIQTLTLPPASMLIPTVRDGLCGLRITRAGGSDAAGNGLAPAPQAVRIIEIKEDIFANGFEQTFDL